MLPSKVIVHLNQKSLTGVHGVQEADQDRFFTCLRLIVERAKEFGGQLFHQAAYTLTELIHFDPNVYPLVAKSGLPNAVIESVKVDGSD